MPGPLITLLTDFGLDDPYAGIMKGVILGICPDAQIVDLTHGIIPYRIAQAAFHLQQSWPYFRTGSIHVVVVDPGVGTSRRPVLLEAGGQYFIGPDNGVFSMLIPTAVRQITICGPPASRTFHGRDIFAPAAAHLAAGAKPDELGTLISDSVRLSFDQGTVLNIDHFGNIITNLRAVDFHGALCFDSQLIQKRVATYAEALPGELFLIEGSSGYIEIALNQGSAAKRLGIGVGAVVAIC